MTLTDRKIFRACKSGDKGDGEGCASLEYLIDTKALRLQSRNAGSDDQWKDVTLELQAIRVLAYLVDRAGQTISYDAYFKEAGAIRTNHALSVQVSRIRNALGDMLEPHRFIKTVHGTGYSFVGEVIEVQLGSITILPADVSIARGASQLFTSAGKFSDGSTKEATTFVRWVCADLDVASITPFGVATGLTGGATVIHAIAENGLSGTAKLRVFEARRINWKAVKVAAIVCMVAIGLTSLVQSARVWRQQNHELQLGKDLKAVYEQLEAIYGPAHTYSELAPGFDDANRKIQELRTINPHSGTARYFRAEFARFQTRAKLLPAIPEGCVPFPASAVDDLLDYIQEEAMVYQSHPSVRQEDDCFGRPDGFCRERTAYVNHLLAYHYYKLAEEKPNSDEKAILFDLSRRYADIALSPYGPQAKGFQQCLSTTTLRTRAELQLDQLKKTHLGK